MEKADLDQIMSSGWPSTFDLALRKIAFGWAWVSSKQNLFLAFYIAHVIIAHSVNSSRVSRCSMLRVNRKKAGATAELFCILPLTNAQCAKGHSQRMCTPVSAFRLHTLHVEATCTLFMWRLSRVGNMLEQARQRNVHTFGGTLSDHTAFHSFLSAIAFE